MTDSYTLKGILLIRILMYKIKGTKVQQKHENPPSVFPEKKQKKQKQNPVQTVSCQAANAALFISSGHPGPDLFLDHDLGLCLAPGQPLRRYGQAKLSNISLTNIGQHFQQPV